MKLTDDQKLQIFCAALNATLQHRVTNGGLKTIDDPVGRASDFAQEAITRLQSGEQWQ
jgi:hypothetical protein